MRKMSYKVELEEFYEIDSYYNHQHCETEMKVALTGRDKAEEIWQGYFLTCCDVHSSPEFKERLPQILNGEDADWYISSVMISMYSTMIHYDRKRLNREEPIRSGILNIETEDCKMPLLKMTFTQTVNDTTSMTTVEMGHGNAPKITEFQDRGYREIEFADPNSEEAKKCEDYNNPVTITEYSW